MERHMIDRNVAFVAFITIVLMVLALWAVS